MHQLFDNENNDEKKGAREVNLLSLMSTAPLTEDNSWLEEKYAPKPIEVPEGELVPDDSGGYSEKISQEIIDRSVSILADLRMAGFQYRLPPNQDLPARWSFQWLRQFQTVTSR